MAANACRAVAAKRAVSPALHTQASRAMRHMHWGPGTIGGTAASTASGGSNRAAAMAAAMGPVAIAAAAGLAYQHYEGGNPLIRRRAAQCYAAAATEQLLALRDPSFRGHSTTGSIAAAFGSRGAPSLNSRYLMQSSQMLGAGHYGSVCKGRDRLTGEEVAIKRVLKVRANASAIQDETSILSELSSAAPHPNIVQLRGVFSDSTAYYIVMELVNGAELYEKVCNEMLPPQHVASVVRQLAEALAHLHARGIVHADVKPENCMYDCAEGSPLPRVKLTDFGSAFRSHTGPAPGKNYTAVYAAPECLLGGSVTAAADVWSLGCVAYILLAGVHPFDPTGHTREETVLENILNAEPNFSGPAWEGVDAAARDFVRLALSKDPAERPSAEQLLAHPWLAEQLLRAEAA